MKKIFLILALISTINNGYSKCHRKHKLIGDKRAYAIACPVITVSFIVFLTPCIMKIK